MRLSLCLFVVLILGGCLPLQTYYRAGAPVDVVANDTLDCEVAALRDAPVAQRIEVDPPFYIPPRTQCDAAGNCETRGGYWVPGERYTVDVNAKLRGQLETRCMARKGYAPVSVPACPPGVARAAAPDRTRILPTLSEQSCVIRYDDGGFQIVTQR